MLIRPARSTLRPTVCGARWGRLLGVGIGVEDLGRDPLEELEASDRRHVADRPSALAIGAEVGQTPAIAETWNGRTWMVPKGTPASFLARPGRARSRMA